MDEATLACATQTISIRSEFAAGPTHGPAEHRAYLLENDDESMDDSETRPIHFTGFKGVCRFDLKVVYEEDDSDAVWNDIDLCKVSLFWNQKTNVTTAVFD